MLKFIFLSTVFAVIGTVSTSTGQSIAYSISMSKPQSHYFEVQMELDNFKEADLMLKMPVWSPGSYLIREFARNVNLVVAKDENGKALSVKKTNKNTWKITKGKSKKVVVNYEVYAFELSVRTSYLDTKHGYFNGTSVFMFVENHQGLSGNLTIIKPETFKTISTALPRSSENIQSDASELFHFTNYDHLVDCPVEIGNQEVFDFTAAGVKHTVSMFGKATYNIALLKKDMARIVEAATKVIGENPNKEYTFIIHNVIGGSGGLEHTNSTTLNVDRNTYEGDAYIGFLGLVAHEYFHLWNVKRIRPVELGPFNYNEENYTSLLWVMEGFTSYYDELLVRRAGYYSEDTYIQKMMSNLNYVEGTPGNRVQPVAHSSFDAWIKSYRPNENSNNTQVSYYPKGQLLAGIIDAMIVKKYDGKKCLDHFMQVLYQDFYKKLNRGFSEAEFQNSLEKFLDTDLDAFFTDYVYGTKTIDFQKYWGQVGYKVTSTSYPKPSFGASYALEGGKVKINNVRANSAAENGGLQVGDEIIGCNSFRTESTASLDAFIMPASNGTVLDLLITREGVIEKLAVKITLFERPSYKIELTTENSRLRDYWLRKD